MVPDEPLCQLWPDPPRCVKQLGASAHLDPAALDRDRRACTAPLHRTAPADAAPQSVLGEALSFARALGARPVEGSYFGFHHEQYGPDQFARVTVLLPARMLAGELMAAAWAHALASALRPLTEGREGSAEIPRGGLLPDH